VTASSLLRRPRGTCGRLCRGRLHQAHQQEGESDGILHFESPQNVLEYTFKSFKYQCLQSNKWLKSISAAFFLISVLDFKARSHSFASYVAHANVLIIIMRIFVQ
jgi:hypothetical protein